MILGSQMIGANKLMESCIVDIVVTLDTRIKTKYFRKIVLSHLLTQNSTLNLKEPIHGIIFGFCEG